MWWWRWHTRRFFRSVMNPIDVETARKWSLRFRFLYIFVAFNTAIYCYKTYYKTPEELREEGFLEDITPAHKKARLMQMGDMTIVRIGPNTPVQTYHINGQQYARDFYERQQKTREEALKRKALNDKSSDLSEETVV